MSADSLTIVNNGQNIRVPANSQGWTTKLDSLKQVAQPLMPWIEKNEQKGYDAGFKARIEQELPQKLPQEAFQEPSMKGIASVLLFALEKIGIITAVFNTFGLYFSVSEKSNLIRPIGWLIGGVIASQGRRIVQYFHARADGNAKKSNIDYDALTKEISSQAKSRHSHLQIYTEAQNNIDDVAAQGSSYDENIRKIVSEEFLSKRQSAAEAILAADKELNDNIAWLQGIITNANAEKLREAVQ